MRQFRNLKFTSLITNPEVLPTLKGNEEERIALTGGAFVYVKPTGFLYYNAFIWGYDVDKHVWIGHDPNVEYGNWRIASYQTAEQPANPEDIDDDWAVVVGWCPEEHCTESIICDLIDEIRDVEKEDEEDEKGEG